ncbi:MAG: peptidyl-prolyl cis-trans isomerase [Planctomycetes bacterium]|nr:peptidyl-prolyl cis-trans isomerase [Planctomycetota bacterium]
MPPPRPRTRRAILTCLVAAAMTACAADAPAQTPGVRATVPAAQTPTIPSASSRPPTWPTSAPENTDSNDADHDKPLDNHVLSSIRANPGAPLGPVRDLIASEVAKAVASGSGGGVVPAAYEAAVATGTSGEPEFKSLETALVVARVGPEVVLEADLLTPKAVEFLEKVTPGMPPEKVRELRLQICQQVLPQHVETLLVYVDACREIPADKLPEIRKNVDRAFDEQQLPRLMKDANAANSLDYEKSLRARGMSLDRMRKMFFERGLAQEWMRKNVKPDEEIAHAELIAWYQNHLSDYDYPAKARFEAITVKMGLKRSRREAWEMLAAMGNEVLAGRPLADVARERSEGPTAASGGAFDWTGKGSLAATRLDEAIFSLPVGQLSTIIEEGEQLHIVRVTERKEAGRTPFTEAQVGIRETLLADRRQQATDDYLSKLRQRTPVWTVFDERGSSPLDPQFTAGRPSSSTTR